MPAACEIAFDENFCPSGTQSVSVLKPLIGSYQVGEKIPGDQPLTKYTSCTAKDDTVGNIDCLAGNYWSSTQMATNSQKSAWPVMFDKELNLHGFFGVSCGKNTNSGDKANQYGVRCARNLTPTY